jgi:flagellar hook assembly protein FlgD
VFNSGPVAGQNAAVVGPNGGNVIFNIPFEITGSSLGSSFVVRENPYNPDHGPAEFRFLPTDPSGVRLNIYSLDGQEVFEREYPGKQAMDAGDSFALVTWDGRNNSGDLVRNGVYIAALSGLKTREQARIKLAVIR